jgi:hypothetical protein
MLFHSSRTRRFRRDRDAEQATDWLARCAETSADAVTAPMAAVGHLPAAHPVTVRPGTPFNRPGTPRPRPRLRPDLAAATAPRRELAPVPAPTIPQLPTTRAPQPPPVATTPAALAQTMPGRTYVLAIPAAPTYAERLAAVFDATADKLTALSGWVTNRSLDDVEVTHARFMNLRDRFADFLPPLRELVAA